MLAFDNYDEPRYRINDDKGVIVGRTDSMVALFRYLNHLARLPTTVLLRGKSGTGKELCAKALHYNGDRGNRNFAAVNCAGIPTELLESILFGHVKGSFTGAHQNTPGMFQYANGGTLLLDEIGDMKPYLQAKLLRVLQEKQVTPVGATVPQEVDVRIVAATNRDLEKLVDKGKFRGDLYYRLNVFPLTVPELHERKDDIPLIVDYFIERFNERYGAAIEGISPSATERLAYHPWKGNIRELENIVERVFVLKRDGRIESGDLLFGSEMPRQIVSHRVYSNPKKVVEGDQWFHDGVLAISPSELSRFEGSLTYGGIMQKADRGAVYMERLETRQKRKCPVLYVTEESLGRLFKDETQDYRECLARIRSNEFNHVARNPFGLFTLRDLASYEITLPSTRELRDVAEREGMYVLQAGWSEVVAVTPENVSRFVLPRSDIRPLTDKIDRAYERFTSWKAE